MVLLLFKGRKMVERNTSNSHDYIYDTKEASLDDYGIYMLPLLLRIIVLKHFLQAQCLALQPALQLEAEVDLVAVEDRHLRHHLAADLAAAEAVDTVTK